MKAIFTLIPVLAVFTTAAHADLITGLTVVDGTSNPFNPEVMGPAKAINGAGLPGNIPALTGTHSATFSDHWWNYPLTTVEAQLTVDLNANYTLSTIQIWNYNEGGVTMRSTKNLEIHVSPDSNVENLVKLVTDGSGTHDNPTGDFLLPQAPGNGTYTGFELDLKGVTNASLLSNVRLVRIKPLDSYDDSTGVGLAEIQFGGTPAPQPAGLFQLIITPNGSNYDFTWDSKNGKLYDLVSSIDLSTPIPEWPVYGGYQNIPGAPPKNLLENVAPNGDKRFFAVIEKDAPPIFNADFEADNGGFTLVGTPNDWAWGTPDSNNNVDLTLSAGNDGSTKCWGTNLGAGGSPPSGLINPAANSILRSPAIDLTGIAGAKLAFAAAYDAAGGDSIEVLIRDAGTDAQLGTAITPFSVPGTSTWTDLGPFDLSPGDNKAVYLEFRYQGTSGDFIGLYIDDVMVTR